MTRLDDWSARLAATMQLWRGRPFVWGVHDCAHWAQAGVQAVTGEQPQMPGCYQGRREARALIREHGGLVAATNAVLGRHQRAFAARRGDIVAVSATGNARDGEVALGVCMGQTVAAFGEHGLYNVPTSDWHCSWSVG